MLNIDHKAEPCRPRWIRGRTRFKFANAISEESCQRTLYQKVLLGSSLLRARGGCGAPKNRFKGKVKPVGAYIPHQPHPLLLSLHIHRRPDTQVWPPGYGVRFSPCSLTLTGYASIPLSFQVLLIGLPSASSLEDRWRLYRYLFRPAVTILIAV